MTGDISEYDRRILERYVGKLHLKPSSESNAPLKDQPPNSPDNNPPVSNSTIDDLIKHGHPYHNTDSMKIKGNDGKENSISVGVAHSLRDARNAVGVNGNVANLPYLIAGKALAPKDNYLHKNWLTSSTEEDVGIDTVGILGSKSIGKPILLVVHGKIGLLTSDYNRILKAYSDGLTQQNAAKYTSQEWDAFLSKVSKSTVYTIEDVEKNQIIDPFGDHIIALDFDTAKSIVSGHYQKTDFMRNKVVLARASTMQYLEKYFDNHFTNVVDTNTVGNWHRFNEINPNDPQGRLLFVDYDNLGLFGHDYLYGYGCFVGVGSAGGAVGARKKSI